MANVYRRGAKDVHRAIVSGGVRYDHAPCMLDGTGGAWTPVIPPGSRCRVCFGGVAAERKRRMATAGGGAGVLALVALVIAGQPDGDPVSSPTPSYIASGAPTATAFVTPEPSVVPPGPTETPALTPSPTPRVTPEPTRFAPEPTLRPDPTPRPTDPPAPAPTCFHPGHNYGVDECRWPHN